MEREGWGRWLGAGCAILVVVALIHHAANAWAGEAELDHLIEAAKKEGEVQYLDNQVQPKTHAAIERAFRKKYALPDSFRVIHTLRGTGEAVAALQQEIKAGQHTVDLAWIGGAFGFFKVAAREGHLLSYVSPEWKPYERLVKRLGLEADPPHWVTPGGNTFAPVWNRKCPGFADLQIKKWTDLLNPTFKGKMILGDVRKSFTYAAQFAAMEGALGKEYFPKLADAVQPVIILRTEEMLQKAMACEYPIAIWQNPSRVYQRLQEDTGVNMAVAWPQEGIVIHGMPMGILKGTRHPNAAKLLMSFLLSEEGTREYVSGEAIFTFREGFRVPEAVRPYAPEADTVHTMPVNWPALTLPEVKRVQDEFRRVFRVD